MEELSQRGLLCECDASAGEYLVAGLLANDLEAVIKWKHDDDPSGHTENVFHKELIGSFSIHPVHDDDEDSEPSSIRYSYTETAEDRANRVLWNMTNFPQMVFSRGATALNVDKLSMSQKKVLFMLCAHFLNSGSESLDVEQIPNINNLLNLQHSRVLSALDGLCSLGIAEKVFMDSDHESERSNYTYRLSVKAVRLLFRGTIEKLNYGELMQYATIVLNSDIKEKTLSYDAGTASKVQDLEKVFSISEYLKIADVLEESGLRPSLSCLFYGAPGSGKTELARQLALKTGRDLVIADVSRLQSMWLGSSEKHYRAIFRSYRYLAALNDNFPILLFNEADGILSKRLANVSSHHEILSNRLQNLLLEELENMEGIFIATTNFASNLDDAFKRRFIYKIHFDRPDVETLKKMWKDKIPSLTESNLDRLVPHFHFTGAQIDNIRSMIVVRECALGREATIDDIISFCEDESMGFSIKDARDESKRIGF